MMPPDSESNITACATLGCPEPATLVGNFTSLVVRERDGARTTFSSAVFYGVTYCTECAGYNYQQFELTGPVRGER